MSETESKFQLAWYDKFWVEATIVAIALRLCDWLGWVDVPGWIMDITSVIFMTMLISVFALAFLVFILALINTR